MHHAVGQAFGIFQIASRLLRFGHPELSPDEARAQAQYVAVDLSSLFVAAHLQKCLPLELQGVHGPARLFGDHRVTRGQGTRGVLAAQALVDGQQRVAPLGLRLQALFNVAHGHGFEQVCIRFVFTG